MILQGALSSFFFFENPPYPLIPLRGEKTLDFLIPSILMDLHEIWYVYQLAPYHEFFFIFPPKFDSPPPLLGERGVSQLNLSILQILTDLVVF